MIRPDTNTALIRCTIIAGSVALAIAFHQPAFLWVNAALIFTRIRKRQMRGEADTLERAFDMLHYDLDALEEMMKAYRPEQFKPRYADDAPAPKKPRTSRGH